MKNLTFGQMIKQKRDGLNLSSAALAKMVGMSRVYLSNIENGRRLPSNKAFKRMEAKLNLPPSFREQLAREKKPITALAPDDIDAFVLGNDTPVTDTISTIGLRVGKVISPSEQKNIERGLNALRGKYNKEKKRILKQLSEGR